VDVLKSLIHDGSRGSSGAMTAAALAGSRARSRGHAYVARDPGGHKAGFVCAARNRATST
jgi:hypothetical protein